MSTHNVASAIRRHAQEQPDAVALRFPSAGYRSSAPSWDAWTYAQLDHHSDAYARGFRRQGVQCGDRCLLLIKPGLDFYAVVFGLFKLGAVPVVLDPGMGLTALLRCIETNAPRVVIAESQVHAIRMLRRRPFASAELFVTRGTRWFWGGANLTECHEPAEEAFELVLRDAGDDAAILFTSGSTGAAKGVASKQAMFAAQVEALRQMFDFQPGQIDVQCFAAFAIFDLCLGMTSVLPHMDLSKPASAKPEDIMAAIHAHEADVCFASPVVWQNVSRHALATGSTLPSVQVLLTVGAPIPAYLHRRFRQILPDGAQVWTPYGATEGLPVSFIGTDEILEGTWDRTASGHGTCVGRIAPLADVAIVPVTDEPMPDWADVEPVVEPGMVGEITVKGPQISPEYKDAPEANRQAKIRDGDGFRHRMGDLGYLDGQGRLWFCGRKKHRLETSAGMLPAVPVEGVFNEHPDVFRTALVGVGERGAEVPVLCVEMEPGKPWTPEVEQALVALAQGTPHDGVVQRFLCHPSFPVDPRHNSKIRREDLKLWVAPRCADLVVEAS